MRVLNTRRVTGLIGRQQESMGTSSAASATRWMIRPATFLLIWLVVVLEACAYFAVRACIFVNERVLLRCRGRAAMARR